MEAGGTAGCKAATIGTQDVPSALHENGATDTNARNLSGRDRDNNNIIHWMHSGVHKDQPKKEQKPPPWCEPCQKEVRPVRPKISLGWLALCIALCWLILLPLVLFAISRLAKEAICPDCRQHIPKAKVPFDTEAVIMTGLIVLWIGAVIGSQIINQINQPSSECATALETVIEGGGRDLWTASDDEIDHWLEENQDAWDLYDRAYDTCWPEDDG